MKDLLGRDWFDEFFAPIEFKSEFDWSSKEKKAAYAKSIVAFANNKGGYLIFGIGRKPHSIDGCVNFDNVDIVEIVDFVAANFHCEVVIQKTSQVVEGKVVGVIAISESLTKPIICTKNFNNSKGDNILKESAIYYRYHGRSSEIKSGDLINMIESIKETINQKWMQSLTKIATNGIQNIGILDTKSGLLKIDNSSFIIEEKLLHDLKVVDKYSEKTDGAPALKIVGEIGEAARIINRNRTIEEFEIIQEFLERKGNYDYMSILERIPNFQSFLYPFLLYLNRTNRTIENYKEILLSKPKYSAQTPFISKMLDSGESWLSKRKQQAPLSAIRERGKKRCKYYNALKERSVVMPIPEENIGAFCEAFLHADKEDFDLEYLRTKLHETFIASYNKTEFQKSIREACCALDHLEFK